MDEVNVVVQTPAGAQTFALAQLAGISLEGIQPTYGMTATPAGVYHWQVKGAELTSMEQTDKATGQPVMRPQIQVSLAALNVLSLADPSQDPAEFVGQEHREFYTLRDVQKDLGRVVALMQDSGFTGNGTLTELLMQMTGHEFICAIKQSPNKKDPDRPYANIDARSVRPSGITAPQPAPHVAQVEAAEAAVAPAAATVAAPNPLANLNIGG